MTDCDLIIATEDKKSAHDLIERIRGFIRGEGYAGTDFQVSEALAFILVRKDRERSNALERHQH